MSILDAPPVARKRTQRPAPLAVIGIQCCRRDVVTEGGTHPGHTAVKKYVDAVSGGAGAMPLLIPAEGAAEWADAIVSRIDGLLLPGSPSNVEPRHYDGCPSRLGTIHDSARDTIVLPLLRAAVRADLPIIAICRGIQELNVALGGSLHQLVHEVPGRLDHRAPDIDSLDERYAHCAHTVELRVGGMLAQIAGTNRLSVNSLHSQGIDRLAPALTIEAVAPDGQIEAVTIPGKSFIVGVQWHPEFRFDRNPFSQKLFAAFGAACRARAEARVA